jgi:hypothetical protein
MFLYSPQLPNLNIPHEFVPRSVHKTPENNSIAVDLSVIENLPVFPARAPALSAVITAAFLNSSSPGAKLVLPDPQEMYDVLAAKTGLASPIYDIVSELNLLSATQFVLHRIASWKQLQLVIAEGLSPLVGHTVYSSFIQAEHTGVVPMPKRGEGLLGGHIVNLVEFNPVDDTLKALSNLGGAFGYEGKLTYRGSFIRNLAICCDFFVLVPGKVIYAN